MMVQVKATTVRFFLVDLGKGKEHLIAKPLKGEAFFVEGRSNLPKDMLTADQIANKAITLSAKHNDDVLQVEL